MQIEELVPFWAKLTKEEQEELKNRILVQNVKKGTIIHNGSEDCTGLIIVEEGQLRAYTLSEDGKRSHYTECFKEMPVFLRHPVL